MPDAEPYAFQGIITKLTTTAGSPYALDVMHDAAGLLDAVLKIHHLKIGVDDRGQYSVCSGCSASPYPCRTAQALGVHYGRFGCGHDNYGTPDSAASVFTDCPTCRHFYCDLCNYDRHACHGCGEPYRHGTDPHPGVSCV